MHLCDRTFDKILVKMGGIRTTCGIATLCSFIIPKRDPESGTPCALPLQQSRVRRSGRLPLRPPSKLHPLIHLLCPHHHHHCPFNLWNTASRLCACFITSVPLRLRRLHRVSGNSQGRGISSPCQVFAASVEPQTAPEKLC